MNIFNIIVFSFYTFSILTLLYFIIKFNKQRKQLYGLCLQFEMDKYLLSQKIEELQKELATRELAKSDGFIKFISQSRDWAFQYIEEVQKALVEFDKEVADKFEWAKTYGIVTNGGTHGKVLDEISVAYNKLKSVLPENTETPNN
jgi:hypothetical protein